MPPRKWTSRLLGVIHVSGLLAAGLVGCSNDASRTGGDRGRTGEPDAAVAGGGSDNAGGHSEAGAATGSGGRAGTGGRASSTGGAHAGGASVDGASSSGASMGGGSGTSGAGAGSGAASSGGGNGVDGGRPEDDTDIPMGKDDGPSTSASRHTKHPLGDGTGAPNGFWEYLPPNYGGSTRAPLLVFWHGIGQNGNGTNELDNAIGEGPPKLIQSNQWPDSRPFVVLSPQHQTAGDGAIAPGRGCPSSAEIHAFLTWAAPHYTVDRAQVFLTGLSCGAVGSWDYLGDHRGELVAAAVLVCGNPGDPTDSSSAWARAGCSLGQAAVWSLHGDADTVVPFAPDRDTMMNLVACPNPPRRAAVFTTVKGGGHGIWPGIYDLSAGSGNVYEWLLEHPKP